MCLVITLCNVPEMITLGKHFLDCHHLKSNTAVTPDTLPWHLRTGCQRVARCPPWLRRVITRTLALADRWVCSSHQDCPPTNWAQWPLLWTRSLHPPQTHMVSPHPWWDGMWRQAFGGFRFRWGHESGAPVMGLVSVLIRRGRHTQRIEVRHHHHHVKKQQEAGPHQTPSLLVP